MLATLLAALCLITTLASSVSAGVYGTSPVANTVWNAGHSQTVTWTDDKSTPHLGQLGLMDIELMSGEDDEHPVATLAQDIDATSKSQNVWISPAWGHNGSDYYVRFSCKTAAISVYTAFFTILDMASLSPASMSNQTADMSDGFYTPYLTLVLPNATIVSTLAPQRTSTRPSPTAPPVSTDDENTYLHAHEPQSNNAARGSWIGNSLGRRIDFERLKFRLVFIIWPALVGITMAM